MVITASRNIFADKIVLNMAVSLEKKLHKIANISNTEVYTSLNLSYGLGEYLIFFIQGCIHLGIWNYFLKLFFRWDRHA